MIAAALRLLALLALILMPFGMGAGMARAEAPASHDMAMSAPADGHCGERDEGKSNGMAGMHCSGSCSALPEAGLDQAEAVALPSAAPAAGLIAPMIGRALLPSIPPPRIA